MTSGRAPVRVAPRYVQRVWGTHDLGPWFPPQSEKIGEVWFDVPDSPLLIKFIYTTEKLSVQVHPADEYARRRHDSRGKTEMWYILDAAPDARIALGPRSTITPDRLREAALSGEIESLLNWVPVHSGDTLFAEAGVIHAIGGGISLCEIQQNSDVTYRLYDYGRPRELHLDDGMAVSALEPYDGRRTLPVRSAFFHTEEFRWPSEFPYRAEELPEHFLIFLEGSGTIEGEDFGAGEVWLAPPGAAARIAPSSPVRGLRTWKPPA